MAMMDYGVPSWVPPAAAQPGYEDLLAQARLRMLEGGGGGGTVPAAVPPVPSYGPGWLELAMALPGSGDGAGGLPGGPVPSPAGGVEERGGGGRAGAMGEFGGGGGGGGGGGFGSGQMGRNWGIGAALLAAMGAPVLGMGLEGGRRANNVSYANDIRGMLGLPQRSWLSDMFSGVGSGNPLASLGTVDIAGRSTEVSPGGMNRAGRTTYTPEEARRRQLAQLTAAQTIQRLARAQAGGGGVAPGGYAGAPGSLSPGRTGFEGSPEVGPAASRSLGGIGRSFRDTTAGGGRGGGGRSERDLDRESRAATGERTSQRGGMGGL